ncbi:hypothetical protein JCM13210_17270 [Thermaerobacter litoralis]
MREGLRWLVQELMELEVSELVGAERAERTETLVSQVVVEIAGL